MRVDPKHFAPHFASLAAVIVVTLGVIFTRILPSYADVERVQGEVTEVERQLDELNQIKQDLKRDYNPEIQEKLKKELDAIQKRLPTGDETKVFVKAIKDICRRIDIQLGTRDVVVDERAPEDSASAPGRKCFRVPVTVLLTTKFSRIGAFLHELKELHQVYVLLEATFTRTDTVPLLKAEIKLATFHYEAPQPKEGEGGAQPSGGGGGGSSGGGG